MRDDNGEQLVKLAYLPDHKQPIPSAVVGSENFGCVSRLLEHKVPVTVSVTINIRSYQIRSGSRCRMCTPGQWSPLRTWLPSEGRVPQISLVFREMWDTTALSL